MFIVPDRVLKSEKNGLLNKTFFSTKRCGALLLKGHSKDTTTCGGEFNLKPVENLQNR